MGGNGENVGCGVAEGSRVAVEVAVGIAVSIACVGCALITGRKPLQDVKIIAIRDSGIIALLKIFTFPFPFWFAARPCPLNPLSFWRKRQIWGIAFR